EQFSPGCDPRSWVIDRLGEGVQSEVFVVRTGDRSPIRQAHPEVVVKLYKPGARGHADVALDEFESLLRLNARLDGVVIDGWTIATPFPLFRSEQPPGVIMTRVPGRSLNSYLRAAGGADPLVLESLAIAVIAALGSYWRGDGRIYGDIDFNNILCDPEA